MAGSTATAPAASKEKDATAPAPGDRAAKEAPAAPRGTAKCTAVRIPYFRVRLAAQPIEY